MIQDRITTRQAAELLGVHEQTMKRWRQQGIGPGYMRVGPRKIFYSREELDRWVVDGSTQAI